MQYMLLINSDESHYGELSEAEMAQLMADYGSFTQDVNESGVLVSAERLQPTSTATTVRVREGTVSTTDGPFAETKEQLGGYYIVDVPHLDDAIQWASKIPSAKYGSVEVRPVWKE